jgi:hypothetical protein
MTSAKSVSEVHSANLQGKIEDIGPVRFIRAEWWDTAPRMVLLRYAIDSHEQNVGLRLDLDKKAILDTLEDDGVSDGIRLDRIIQDRLPNIWDVVIRECFGAQESPSAAGAHSYRFGGPAS